MNQITYNELPNAASQYLNVVKDTITGSKPGLKKGQNIPRIDASINGYQVDRAHLKEYSSVCGFPDTAALPITFPHIVAFPLQMGIMNHDKFPLKLLGLVHVRNSIRQYRAIKATETLDVKCWVEGQTSVDAGIEFDLVTQAYVDNELVWEEISTNLSRKGSSGNKSRKKRSDDAEKVFSQYVTIEAPDDIGRRYGAVSGDRNPIHMYHLTAKLLGFKKAIAHGMWSLARVAAELSPQHPAAQQLDIAFKLPLFLPGSMLLRYYDSPDESSTSDNNKGQQTDFKLISGDGKKPHGEGRIINLE